MLLHPEKKSLSSTYILLELKIYNNKRLVLASLEITHLDLKSEINPQVD